MKDPALKKRKSLKPVFGHLREKLWDIHSAVQQMAVRGLGRVVSGAPVKVKLTLQPPAEKILVKSCTGLKRD